MEKRHIIRKCKPLKAGLSGTELYKQFDQCVTLGQFITLLKSANMDDRLQLMQMFQWRVSAIIFSRKRREVNKPRIKASLEAEMAKAMGLGITLEEFMPQVVTLTCTHASAPRIRSRWNKLASEIAIYLRAKELPIDPPRMAMRLLPNYQKDIKVSKIRKLQASASIGAIKE